MALPPYPLPRETRETTILVGSDVDTYGPFTFKIFDENDVDVWRLDAGETDWALQAVTVTKTADLAHDYFSITFPATVPATTQFMVSGRRLHERQVAVTRGGAIDSTMLEKELSKQGAILQELRRDLSRSVRFPPGFDGQPFLPTLIPGKAIIVNPDADGLTVGPNADEIASAQGYSEVALAAKDAALLAQAAAEAARDIALNSVPTVFTATLITLAQLNPSENTHAYLTATGDANQFQWLAGDQSGIVDGSDFVAPGAGNPGGLATDGSDGVWVRIYDKLEDGKTTTAKLDDLAVTGAKLAAGSVGLSKFATDVVDTTNFETRLGANIRADPLYDNDPVLTGHFNVLVGQNQLTTANERSTHVTALGYDTARYGYDNYGLTVMGFRSGSNLVGTQYITGLGIDCFTNTVSANASTAVGAHCCTYKTQVDLSFIAGSFAAFNAGVVTNSVAIGYSCGGTQTVSPATVYSYDNCVLIGWKAGQFMSGDDNVIIGYNAVGGTPMIGAGNICIGSGAGNFGAFDGSQNTTVGQNAGPNTAASNSTSIGYDAHAGASNHIVLGNAAISSLRCQQTTITALSDERDKPQIEQIPLGLDFIVALDRIEAIVRHTWDMRDGKWTTDEWFPGVTAQRLAAVEDQFDAQWMGLVDRSDPDRLEATPGKLLFPLLRAVAELSAKVDAQSVRIAELEGASQ